MIQIKFLWIRIIGPDGYRDSHSRIMHFRIFFFLFLFILPVVVPLYSQDTLVRKDSIDFYDMSLEQLLNLKTHGVPSHLEELVNTLIAAATKKPLSARESPGIISLITAEDIQRMGARDLIDVLNHVPGIEFGVDVLNVVGVGMRGNWGQEGKVLLMIDGQEMNEVMASTLQFGNHYPVDNIAKIEIIRGPGSAIYGGFAEYGVINIVTKNADMISGGSFGGCFTATVGRMGDTTGRTNIGMSIGKKSGNVSAVLHVWAGSAARSDRDFTDFYGNTFNMAGNSDMKPVSVNAGIFWKDLSIRAIYDRYVMSTRDGYGENLSRAYPDNFYSYYGEVKYTWRISEKLSLTPRVNYIRQIPWNYVSDPLTDTLGEYETYDKIAVRNKINLTVNYKPARKTTVVGGAEFFTDNATDRSESGYFQNGEQAVSYTNYALFGEAVHKHRIVNLILGGRYDNHTQYGSTFSPRVGLTKRITKDFHVKALYSHSFRAPGIDNINYSLNPDEIKPERTKVTELETGYQLTRNMIVTANIFDITTVDPIIYYGISDTEQYYMNLGKTGTRGFEVECKYKEEGGYVTASYAFYSAGAKETVEAYEVAEDNSYLLGFAKHKINALCNFKLSRHLSFTTAVNYRGSRYAYTWIDNDEEPVIEKLNPSAFLNVFFLCENIFKGLNLGFGVFDLFNTGALFIQPYNSFHAPLPGPSREIVVKLSYNVKFPEMNLER
ncbi:MAG: TonB-dependent receptor [Bacteroidetes bacterium]|nr:TonB-dependent receptor [Bacteroidota bacterium]